MADDGSLSDDGSMANGVSLSDGVSGPRAISVQDGMATLLDETHSLTDPASPWVIVNKTTQLSPDYAPTDLTTPNLPIAGGNGSLRLDAANALTALSKAAEAELGQPLQLVSGFRPFDYQGNLYRNYFAEHGQERADTFSARAGFSEHQSGLAADVTEVGGDMNNFGATDLGRWTAENAWRFGFIVRYTEANRGITGYMPEPWHLRYIGEPLAKYYHGSGAISLETLFGLPPAPNYS
jgi:D-alanyl-D-alanine carboxypeptidase